jgi:PAS domain S-box-containing protein
METLGQPIDVLYVDDEPDFAAVAGTYLEREDDRFTVETAPDADTGLERLDRGDFDCVVSDYEMPVCNGIEFLEAVRETFPNLPFVLYTGKGSEEVAGEAISAGVTDYLQKETGTGQYAVLANRIGNAVEQYRARESVEETERKLSQLAEKTDDVFFMVGGDWSELLFINASFEEIWDRPVSELEAEPRAFLESVHPDDRERARESMRRLSAGEPDEIEYRIVQSDGEQRWVRGRSKPIFDEDGEVERIAGFVRDITDRKEREAAIDWHRAVLRNMREGVYVLDPEYEFQFVNYRNEEIDELAETDWSGHTLGYLDETDILSPEEVAWIREGIDRIVAGDADQVCIEIEPRLPAASEVVDLELTPLDLDRDRELVLATSRDITDRRRRERRLERFETFMADINDAAFIVDSDWRVEYANDASLRNVGAASEDVEGQQIMSLVETYVADSEGVAGFERTLDRAFGADEPAAFSDRVELELSVGEERRIFEYQFSPIATAGETDVVAVTAREITDRKRRERELEQKTERLEELTRVVSHDLRNPLHVAEGRLQLASEECDSPHIEDVRHALDRMDELLDTLLTLALEENPVGERRAVDLADLVEGCWRTVGSPAARLVVDTDRTVRADRSRLRQLVENLVRNASEHGTDRETGGTDASGGNDPAVTVTVGDLPDGFYVADDGPGIPEPDRDRVFDAGYSTGGIGLGLAIVKEVAVAHGWEVAVTDSTDGGARFEITGVDSPDPGTGR